MRFSFSLIFVLISCFLYSENDKGSARFSRKNADRQDYEMYKNIKIGDKTHFNIVTSQIETQFEEPLTELGVYYLKGPKPDFRFTFHPEFSYTLGEGKSYFNFVTDQHGKSKIHLKLKEKVSDAITVELTDEQGKVLVQQSITMSSDEAFLTIDLAKLPLSVNKVELTVKAAQFWEGFSFIK